MLLSFSTSINDGGNEDGDADNGEGFSLAPQKFQQFFRLFFLSISQGSRRDRDIFFQVSCFEMGLRDEINLILTRIFVIEKSC